MSNCQLKDYNNSNKTTLIIRSNIIQYIGLKGNRKTKFINPGLFTIHHADILEYVSHFFIQFILLRPFSILGHEYNSPIKLVGERCCFVVITPFFPSDRIFLPVQYI